MLFNLTVSTLWNVLATNLLIAASKLLYISQYSFYSVQKDRLFQKPMKNAPGKLLLVSHFLSFHSLSAYISVFHGQAKSFSKSLPSNSTQLNAMSSVPRTVLLKLICYKVDLLYICNCLWTNQFLVTLFRRQHTKVRVIIRPYSTVQFSYGVFLWCWCFNLQKLKCIL